MLFARAPRHLRGVMLALFILVLEGIQRASKPHFASLSGQALEDLLTLACDCRSARHGFVCGQLPRDSHAPGTHQAREAIATSPKRAMQTTHERCWHLRRISLRIE